MVHRVVLVLTVLVSVHLCQLVHSVVTRLCLSTHLTRHALVAYVCIHCSTGVSPLCVMLLLLSFILYALL